MIQRLTIALLLAADAFAQTMSNYTVQGTTHSSTRLSVDKSDATTEVYAIVSTSAISNCTLSSSQRRLGTPDGSTTAIPVFLLTGLTPSTTYTVGICKGSDNSLLGSSTDLFSTSAVPSPHPAKPTAPATPGHTGIPAGPYSRDLTATTCAEMDSMLDDLMNDAGVTDNMRLKAPYDLNGGDCQSTNISLPARGAGSTGYIVVQTTATKVPPWGARYSLFDSNKVLKMGSLTAVSGADRVVFDGIMFAGPTTGATVDIANPSDTIDFIFRGIVERTLGTTDTTRSAFGLLGGVSKMTIRDSYLETTRGAGNSNSTCINVTGGAERLSILNNSLRCVGNTIYFEQHTEATPNRDVEIRQNTFDWDERYRQGSATFEYNAGAWQAGEFKQCIRCAVTGNWFKNGWADQDNQNYAWQITARSEDGASYLGHNTVIAAITDIEWGFNWISGFSSGLGMIGLEGDVASREPRVSARIYSHDNLHSRTRTEQYANPGCCGNTTSRGNLHRVGGVEDLIIENNLDTFDVVGSSGVQVRAIGITCGPIEGVQARNNLFLVANGGGGGWFDYDEGPCPWPDGSEPSQTGSTKDKMDEFFTPSYTYTNNGHAAQNGFTAATLNGAGFLPTGNYVLGDGSLASLAGFVGNDPASTNVRNFCLALTSANNSRAVDGRWLGPNCIKLQEQLGGVYNVVVSAIGTTTATILYNAPGGLTGPGTVTYVDVSTSSVFTEATTSRFTSTVNSAIPWAQSASITGLTTATAYYFRIHAAGEPYTSGTFTTK